MSEPAATCAGVGDTSYLIAGQLCTPLDPLTWIGSAHVSELPTAGPIGRVWHACHDRDLPSRSLVGWLGGAPEWWNCC